MKIVVITIKDDAHVSFVSNHLSKSTEVVIVDPFGDIGKKDISYAFSKGHLRLFHGQQELNNIDSVWYRKPSPLCMDELNIPLKYHAYSEDALRNHVATLRRHWPKALWVSKFEAIVRAEQKPHQLELASSLGFAVPATLATGDKNLAQRFVQSKKICIAKTQGTEFPLGKVMLTRVISNKDPLDYSGLHVDPMIFQEYIKPAYELRVTVVGKEIFAAKVGGEDIGHDGAFRDWRYAHINNTFYAEATKIDTRIAELCIKLVRQYGLNYGAIDLIVDKKGQPWFLEINPNGQWAFIEEQTKQPIGKAIAKLLEHKA